jgi:hypothetical protein
MTKLQKPEIINAAQPQGPPLLERTDEKEFLKTEDWRDKR